MRAKEVTLTQDEVKQEDSEQNEVDGMKKGADSTGKVMYKSLSTERKDGRGRCLWDDSLTSTTQSTWVSR